MSKRTRSKQKSTPDFASFIPDFSNRLQQISDTYLDSFNEEKAFVYLIAELFETTIPDKYEYTDGPKDGGIDFSIKDANSYIICQCKYSALDAIPGENPIIPTFDQSPLEELSKAIDMLTDNMGDYDVKNSIKRFRGDFQKDCLADPEATKLIAILAVSGELTPQAKTAFISKNDS